MKSRICSSAFRRLRAWPPEGGTACLFILAALLIFSPVAKASQPAASQIKYQKSERFISAQAAYDEGRYAEAAQLYGQLADNGVDNVELHYNLANAHFKNGNLPEAVLHYRKAWYKAPRDPDIRANLHFALNAVGAAEPTPSFLERLFNVLPQNGWIMAATGGYIALVLVLILGMLIRPAKRTLTKLSLLPAVLILLAAGGWWHWQKLTVNAEWVVVKSGATALFGPIEGSTAHYKIPLAALVRQHGIDSKGWIEIEYDGKKGWLKEAYIKRVYP
jgi:tetratricopeptide (TPR) repeat protein